eukprot:CAMPEP_0114406232 /NCGR_PEP_ID=MMETSP0102-20121206/21036_1 /TAXON_ID=38822 ORGANISM="Pteridomonas danica, Strain PT" /NCGR_SAMPLE_ID=MMETSP0102 /ASSEMBLY_ACC=CAM_ASM_000212 /LENGTH=145 /DNA_ID=CAMNT_0001572093 /DNA_START=87 /DNA_END=521 /DNA_ORIENTATION=-
MTPLMFAAQGVEGDCGGGEAVEAILKTSHCDRFMFNDNGKQAYDLAFAGSRSDVCMLLRYDPQELNLCALAAQGHIEAVSSLLRQGATPKSTTPKSSISKSITPKTTTPKRNDSAKPSTPSSIVSSQKPMHITPTSSSFSSSSSS